MKCRFTYFTPLFILCFSLTSVAQIPTLSPAETEGACPLYPNGVMYTVTNLPVVTGGWTIDSPVGCSLVNSLNGNYQFSVSFTDAKEAHSVRLDAVGYTKTFTFTHVNTLDGVNPQFTPPLQGIPPGYGDLVTIPICASGSFRYTGPTVYYLDASGAAYGSPMGFYDYLVPAGWSVNGQPASDGVTPLMTGSPTVTITADPLTGGGQAIMVRARNNCNPTSFKPSNWFKVFISRPVVRLTSGGATSLHIACGDQTPRTFTLENAPSCVTSYQWNLGSPNGWTYQGSPAPSTITTTTNSIVLTPSCNQLAGAVSVTPYEGSASSTPFSCAVSTTPPVDMYINGDYIICSSSTFTIHSLPCNASVVWSVTPQGIVNMQSNADNSVTLTKLQTGRITLNADVTSCGGTVSHISQQYIVGLLPQTTWPTVVSPTTGCLKMGSNISYTASFLDPTTTGWLNWGYYEGQTGGTLHIVETHAASGNIEQITIPNSQQYNRIYVQAENECGTTAPAIKVFQFSSSCTGGGGGSTSLPGYGQELSGRVGQDILNSPDSTTDITVIPSPASDIITVTKTQPTSGGSPLFIQSVRLYDIPGKLIRSFNYSDPVSSVKINVSNLLPGIYFLEVSNGKERKTKKIMIQR